MSIELAIGLAALTSLALGLLLVPLLGRQRTPAAREAYNIAVYRDQLAEVDRDLSRGLLNAAQAEAARAEIGRRILAVGRDDAAPPSGTAPSGTTPGGTRPSGTRPVVAAVIAILVLPVAALAIYARIGSPSLPDQPLAARRGAPANAAAAAIDMQEALAKLRAHLKTHPDDLTGWLLLARSEFGLVRYTESVAAYARAAELSEQRPDIVGDWGEAQVMAAGGAVTPQAATAFEAALKDPGSAPRARYYLALAKLQHGDPKSALKEWAALEADSPADAEWLPMLRRRIADVAKEQGVDPASLNAAAPAKPGAGGMPAPDAVAAAARAAADASPEERRAMIAAMVERLAARLAEHPDDVEGWARLGRSYMVLNQPEKARSAYAQAVKLAPGDAALAALLAEATRAAAAPTPAASGR